VNWRGLGVTTTGAALLGGAYFLLLWGSGLSNSSAEAGIIDPAVACDDGTGPCPAAISGWAYGLLALSVALSLAAAYLAARHRRQLRERHGLPGTPTTDFLLWWCCAPCEACREARTVVYAPVNGGVWGAPPGAAGGVPPPPPPAAVVAPKPQEMAKLEAGAADAKV
jgi:Cys-rich protein (TIGR01571 family)